jgi:hypothetical protein
MPTLNVKTEFEDVMLCNLHSMRRHNLGSGKLTFVTVNNGVGSGHKVRRKACFNIWSKSWGIVELIGPAFAGCAVPQRKENPPCRLILMR